MSTPAASTQGTGAAVAGVSRLRWVVIGFAFLATVLNYIDRQTLSVLAPTLKDEFAISDSQYGLIVSSFLGPTHPGVWSVDGDDGRLVEMEPLTDRRWMPAHRPVRPARERQLHYAASAEPHGENDHGGGNELEHPPGILHRDDGTFNLFDLDAYPAPRDDEPVFWA